MSGKSLVENGDVLLFAEESPDESPKNLSSLEPWNVLVVDDEDDMHAVTKLVFEQFEFNGRGIRLLHATSGREAKRILEHTAGIALILLDVVMESDDAGLRLVEYVRSERRDRCVRIILRTGQAGLAPERRVLHEFDINDYNSKAELTASRLYTSVLTALRSYEDLIALETSRHGFEKILQAASSLLQMQSLELFASGALAQLGALMGTGRSDMLCAYRGGFETTSQHDVFVLAATGSLGHIHGKLLLDNDVAPEIANPILRSLSTKASIELDNLAALYYEVPHGREIVVLLHLARRLNDVQRDLARAFCEQLSAAMDHLGAFNALRASHERLEEAHAATVVTLAKVAEMRSREVGDHVRRIAEMSAAIATFMRRNSEESHLLNDAFIQAIGVASILHDVGKVAIPADILSKPGSLEEEELYVMRCHARAGRSLLEKVRDVAPDSTFLELAIEIAGGHHEWFDGTGYPDGLSGTRIPLSARIVAVAEVFDVLTHDRSFDEPWPVDRAVAHIEQRSGTQFDPGVVRAFLAVL